MTLAAGIGYNIRDQRKELGITQEELAHAADLRQSSIISHYECGRQLPTVPNLVKLADALNVSTDWLLGRDAIRLRY